MFVFLFVKCLFFLSLLNYFINVSSFLQNIFFMLHNYIQALMFIAKKKNDPLKNFKEPSHQKQFKTNFQISYKGFLP